ncbi:MAG: Peptidase and chymotrypsin/Hap [Actinomycetia bacterium]|nr:Peptidase and chymotrypsin/Hap [Actinomycetes bacterium]
MTQAVRRRRRIGPGVTFLVAGVAIGGLVVLAALTFGDASDRGGVETAARRTLNPVARAMAVAPSVLQVRLTGGAYRRIEAVCVGDGIALTSASAISGASSIRVRGEDGKQHRAVVVGRDPQTDLALLDLNSVPGTALVADSVESDAVGSDDVVFSVAATASPEPVSITGWDEMLSSSSGVVASGLLRSTAGPGEPAPTPGSVLVDAKGRVVGIVIGFAAPTGGDRYAVPMDVALDVARQIHDTGAAVHGWVGIAGRDHATAPSGTEVVHVADGSPAAAAGIREGDVIVAVEGAKSPRMAVVLAAVRRREPGDALRLTVERAGKSRTVQINVSGPTTTTAAGPTAATTSVLATASTASPKPATTGATTSTTARGSDPGTATSTTGTPSPAPAPSTTAPATTTTPPTSVPSSVTAGASH